MSLKACPVLATVKKLAGTAAQLSPMEWLCKSGICNMVKRYIEIMRFVYHLNIEFTVEVEQEIMDCYSIKLILQPIVENAVVHGLRPKNGGSLIISGYQKENTILLEVSDDGVGMNENTLKDIEYELSSSHHEKGYGMTNVIGRINLFFGSSYDVDIISMPDAGTTVTVRIPRLNEFEMESLLENRYPV